MTAGADATSTAPGRASVWVNGRAHDVAEGQGLLDFLREKGIDTDRVAIERNREVMPRARHAELTMHDGDRFEVVHFVGGG